MNLIPRLFLTLAAMAGAIAAASGQAVYHVSAECEPGGDGSLSSPFSSVAEALQECRGREGATTIYLRGGVHRLKEPLVITSYHSNASHHLTISSYPGEKAVISGSIALSPKWKGYRDGILKAKVGNVPVMDVLFADGRRLTMARYPDYDSSATRFGGTSAEATSPLRVKSWKDPAGGYLHAMHAHDWGDFHYMITGKDAEGNLEMTGGWQNNRPMGLHPDNRMVENIFEELDSPGEWYYDRQGGTLYYYPLPGEVPGDMLFESAQLANLVSVEGSTDDPVRNLTISGICFTQTRRTFMEAYEPLLRSDWTIYRGGAVFLEGTEDCTFTDCDFRDLGGNGIFFSRSNRRSSVCGSLFADIGASAVCFVGDPKDVRSASFRYEDSVAWDEMDFAKGPKGSSYPSECSARDNLIHGIGLFEKQVSGVEISMSRRITVSHNSIYDTPRSGINISEGTWGGHLIEYNDVFSTVKETGDHGSINAWGRDRYWCPDYSLMEKRALERPDLILADMMEPNVISHNRFRCDRGWDIDLDDGASLYIVRDNLCLCGGIKLREGFYRLVENNIIVNNTLHSHVWFKESGDVFTRNIVMTPYLPVGENLKGRMVDHNIFTDSLAFRKARSLGLDEGSIVSPAWFKDPSKGDFTLPDDSEAIVDGGFMNIPMDGFGVLSQRLRAISRTPAMPVPQVTAARAGSETWEWLGVRLKSLDTLGERSATGMDSERGVYVISLDGLNSPLRDFLSPGDVILEYDGSPVRDLDGFKAVAGDHQPGKPVIFKIFRSQRLQMVTLP